MLLTRGENPYKQHLGMSVIPGITQLTPPYIGRSARINGGMGFGLGAMGGTIAFQTDASGNSVMDANGNPIAADGSDWSTIADLVQKGMAVLNSQQVFQLNLDRAQRGLAPINVPAPQVGLSIAGLNSQSIPFLILGALALVLLIGKR